MTGYLSFCPSALRTGRPDTISRIQIAPIAPSDPMPNRLPSGRDRKTVVKGILWLSEVVSLLGRRCQREARKLKLNQTVPYALRVGSTYDSAQGQLSFSPHNYRENK